MQARPLRLTIILLLGGLTTLAMAYREMQLSRKAQADPQVLSLEELADRGPGDNMHVLVTDVFLCSHLYLYEGTESRIDKAWIPATPRNGVYHRMIENRPKSNWATDTLDNLEPPRDIKVLVKIDRPDTWFLDNCYQEDTIQGLVLNEIESLSQEEADLLESGYPGIDFQDCWIVELNRKPAGPIRLFVLFGAALAFMAIAAWALIRQILARPDEPRGGWGLD